MKAIFVHTVENVDRFLAGINLLQERGAPEACLLLVTGRNGFGKSRTMDWYMTQERNVIYLRAKSGWSRTEFFREFLESHPITKLERIPTRTADMRRMALGVLGDGDHTLVVDEIENALPHRETMEAIRDLTDVSLTPGILVGMDGVKVTIRSRYPHFYSRLSTVVTFEPVSVADVQACAATLLDVRLGADVVEEIHKRCDGQMRPVIDALATCERVSRQRRAEILTLDDLKNVELVHDWKSRAARPVPLRVKHKEGDHAPRS